LSASRWPMARQASGLLEADLPSSDRAGVEHPWLQYTLTDRRSTAAPGRTRFQSWLIKRTTASSTASCRRRSAIGCRCRPDHPELGLSKMMIRRFRDADDRDDQPLLWRRRVPVEPDGARAVHSMVSRRFEGARRFAESAKTSSPRRIPSHTVKPRVHQLRHRGQLPRPMRGRHREKAQELLSTNRLRRSTGIPA
jgi:hypothetical protein